MTETTSLAFPIDWRDPVSTDERIVGGIAVPWNETSRLTPRPGGRAVPARVADPLGQGPRRPAQAVPRATTATTWSRSGARATRRRAPPRRAVDRVAHRQHPDRRPDPRGGPRGPARLVQHRLPDDPGPARRRRCARDRRGRARRGDAAADRAPTTGPGCSRSAPRASGPPISPRGSRRTRCPRSNRTPLPDLPRSGLARRRVDSRQSPSSPARPAQTEPLGRATDPPVTALSTGNTPDGVSTCV